MRRYRVMRPVDDPNYVLGDLEFDGTSQAEAFRVTRQEPWHGAEARGLIKNPRARIVEAVESKKL